ncbi:MAG: hypothetical protein V4757_07450 [Pseudomonadota bacterium]
MSDQDRQEFEAHWFNTRGRSRARKELKRHELQPQTYVCDSANRHWVTWQAARTPRPEADNRAVAIGQAPGAASSVQHQGDGLCTMVSEDGDAYAQIVLMLKLENEPPATAVEAVRKLLSGAQAPGAGVVEALSEDEEQARIGALIYRGNTVSYMYSKAKNYGGTVLQLWGMLAEAGYKVDGENHVRDMLKRCIARAALSAAPHPAGEVPGQLHRFYGVSTDAALIEAQAAHIEKLQAKLPRNDMPAFTRVREG